MKKTSVYFAFMLFLSLGTFAQDTESYETYHNPRFDFCLQYPASFEAGIAPTNGDGLSFHHEKLESKIFAYGALQMPKQTLQSLFEVEKEETEVELTYEILKDNFYVVSGITKDDKIFYRKTVLKDEVFLTLIYEYPQKYASYFKKVIEENSLNFPNCK